jgi:hypothetical protein
MNCHQQKNGKQTREFHPSKVGACKEDKTQGELDGTKYQPRNDLKRK